MRYTSVNGWMLRSKSFCALYCKPNGLNYLREIETRISYCEDKCCANPAWARSWPSKIVRKHHD
jgi:hypothetical protein